jgi:hypothetical protein
MNSYNAPSSARQLAREIVDAQKGWTTERDHSYDANHLILANALLSEPVAWMYHICDDGLNDITQSKKTVAGWPDKSRIVPLYAAPLVEAGTIEVTQAMRHAGVAAMLRYIFNEATKQELCSTARGSAIEEAYIAMCHARWAMPDSHRMKQEPEGHGTTSSEKD